MTNAGRAFGFYIKYWHEMEYALYRSDERKEHRKELTEETCKMIDEVGRRADDQAAELIKRCCTQIEERFGELSCHVKRVNQRDATRSKYGWWAELWLWPKPGRNHWRWQVGISVEEDRKGSPAIFLYLWMQGRRKAEEKLVKVFGERIKYRSGDFDDWNPGSVFIGDAIPLRADNHDGFKVDADKLLNELQERLKLITKRDVRRLFGK
jgi:hypothetical protein